LAITSSEYHFRMSDGFDLFGVRWGAAREAERAVVCVHGLPGEAAQFEMLARSLALNGTEVYAIDLRGFGNSVESGLPRGDTRGTKRQLRDVDEVLAQVRKNHPSRHVFILGHSIGCDYSLWQSANHPESVDGLVLLAPGVRLTSRQSAGDMMVILLSLLFAPTKTYDLQKAFSHGVRSSKELRILLENPLITTRLTVRYLGGLRPLITKVLENASKVERQALIVQGDADVWVRPGGAKELVEALRSKDKTMKMVPGAGHFFFGALLPGTPPEEGAGKQDTLMTIVNGWLNGR